MGKQCDGQPSSHSNRMVRARRAKRNASDTLAYVNCSGGALSPQNRPFTLISDRSLFGLNSAHFLSYCPFQGTGYDFLNSGKNIFSVVSSAGKQLSQKHG
ncbi:conserved hypothetical protein [Coccidioides posadasii str. Silveira]|uniref:Uncharacterized protein n=2 Tax=Coccidioides posadasii TaxID=199306 RepID=E9CUZ6_COCPS|nr:conserved hypothetical protein [Coccidioides posadasii str. Silveira]KMM71595.1 hypothetical protein CPAG_07898 [Coccidioides posadasii RMSCC 3488]